MQQDKVITFIDKDLVIPVKLEIKEFNNKKIPSM